MEIISFKNTIKLNNYILYHKKINVIFKNKKVNFHKCTNNYIKYYITN